MCCLCGALLGTLLISYYFTLLFTSEILTEIYIFLILCSDCDTFNYVVFFYQKHHPEDGQITG